jgi:hypothetical protein
MTWWQESWRADPRGAAIADRHYNRQKIGAAQFVPPGSCVVFRHDDDALWITSWPIAEYVQHEWAGAWVNSLFRNESDRLSSELILEAVAHTRAHYDTRPGLGMVTFVDASKVRPKQHPGYCYLMAGFEHVGFTKGGLLAYQLLPEAMPEAVPVDRRQPSLFS